MQNYFTKLILGFKDSNIIITNNVVIDDEIILDIELDKQIQKCPSCKKETKYIHDYRLRKFKHGTINGYFLTIKYNRRRFICKPCNKRFPEQNTFIDRYAKISNNLNDMLIKRFENKLTFKQIAKDNNVSSSTVIRRFDKHLNINTLTLPSIISIDEFKKSTVNTKDGKYALAIADPINKKLIDIIPNRRKHEFNTYLDKIPVSIKNGVNIAITDMWEPYRDLIYKHFPNAKIVIDRFHYIRNVLWWLNDIRVQAMNSYNTNQKGYKILKRYHKLINKNPLYLRKIFVDSNFFKKMMSQQSIVNECLQQDPNLKEAYLIYKFFQTKTDKQFKTVEEAITFIDEFVQLLFDSKLHNSQELAGMFINWKIEIANSLTLSFTRDNKQVRYTNGFIEGVNNYIKTFRRMCFNIRNFERFKIRIITTFNNDYRIVA